jgi:hypothetical protein
MPWLAASLLVAAFLILARLFGLQRKSKHVLDIVSESLTVIRDKEVADEVKEKKLQQRSLELFRLFSVLCLGGAAAVAVPLAVVWLCCRLLPLSFGSVIGVLQSPLFLSLSGSVAVVVLLLGSHSDANDYRYPALDKLLHRTAFHTMLAQISIADFEDRIFARQLAHCSAECPVFITALPRAGTTLLLECMARMPEFAAHCYSDMPFVLIPCFWNRFSSAFRRRRQQYQRAHGDGMLIHFDSPEAFEEVLWKTFWRKHYAKDRIKLWHAERNDEFNDFFRNHMRKIILVRRKGGKTARYLSKNNLNIARVAWLARYHSSAAIIVPFREPLQHALSLLHQHMNFLHIHDKNPFASEYMRAIGHFDFGDNLRPVDFGGWLDRRVSGTYVEISFWLEYWIECYRYLLQNNAGKARFLDYDCLCTNPMAGLKMLAKEINARNTEALLSSAASIRQPRRHEEREHDISSSLLRNARELHAELQEIAVNKVV